ncbi:MAG: PepSY domain-containing protein [Cyanothece sp. SIO2G6]|nr:PepSY domain-containing protein [Cyanothece sp. SIO2G6]
MFSSKKKLMKWSLKIHKYLGVALCLFLISLAVTGIFLSYKNAYDWMQAPTARGTEGSIETMMPLSEAVDKIMLLNLPEFQTPDDINRIDIRLGKGTYKVRGKGHSPLEVQLDAQTGEVLSQSYRWGDWIEHLHTGEIISEPMRRTSGTVLGVTTIVLSLTGLVLWAIPALRKKRQRMPYKAKSETVLH